VNQTDFLQVAVGNMDYARVCKSFLPCGTPMSTGAGSEVMRGDLAAAQKAVAASGYDGTKAVILSAGDNPIVLGCTQVAADLFKKIGITPDLQVMDIATMIQRRTSMEPVDHGGWSVFVAYGESAQFSNPSTHIALRADGKAAWPGWPTDAKLMD
jgi:peptide/nickel transport system substrate-binding protein